MVVARLRIAAEGFVELALLGRLGEGVFDRGDVIVVRGDDRVGFWIWRRGLCGLGQGGGRNLEDVTRGRARELVERYADQRDHLSGGDARRRDVIIIKERRRHHMWYALRMIGHVDDDEEIATGAQAQTGQAPQPSHVVDRFPDLDQPVDGDHRFGAQEELAGLSKVEQLDFVRHGKPLKAPYRVRRLW